MVRASPFRDIACTHIHLWHSVPIRVTLNTTGHPSNICRPHRVLVMVTNTPHTRDRMLSNVHGVRIPDSSIMLLC